MLTNHLDVLETIQSLHEVRVTWPSKDDGGLLQTRRCALMDYGPSRRYRDGSQRYHFWDFESDSGRNHNLSLLAEQITAVEILETTFSPSEFVTWTTAWFKPRTSWGEYN